MADNDSEKNPQSSPEDKQVQELSQKIAQELAFKRLMNEGKITAEDASDLGQTLGETILNCSKLKKLDPFSINFTTSPNDSEEFKVLSPSLAQRWNSRLATATIQGIDIPEDSVVNWANHIQSDPLTPSRIIAHEMHHVWANRNFPNYTSKMREMMYEMLDQMVGYKNEGKQVPQELLTQFLEVRVANLMEKSALLFEREYTKEYLLPKIPNRLARTQKALQLQAEFLRDYVIITGYRSLTDMKI